MQVIGMRVVIHVSLPFVSVCREGEDKREWRSWSEQLTVLLDWEAGEVVHGNIHGCGNNAFEEAVIAAPFFAPQMLQSEARRRRQRWQRWWGRMHEHMYRRLHLPSS